MCPLVHSVPLLKCLCWPLLFAAILLQLTLHLLAILHQFYLHTLCLHGIILAVWYQYWKRTKFVESDSILSFSIKYDVQKNA